MDNLTSQLLKQQYRIEFLQNTVVDACRTNRFFLQILGSLARQNGGDVELNLDPMDKSEMVDFDILEGSVKVSLHAGRQFN